MSSSTINRKIIIEAWNSGYIVKEFPYNRIDWRYTLWGARRLAKRWAQTPNYIEVIEVSNETK